MEAKETSKEILKHQQEGYTTNTKSKYMPAIHPQSSNIPKGYKAATIHLKCDKWKAAMEKELEEGM